MPSVKKDEALRPHPSPTSAGLVPGKATFQGAIVAVTGPVGFDLPDLFQGCSLSRKRSHRYYEQLFSRSSV